MRRYWILNLLPLVSFSLAGEITLPEGTKIRVRLEQTLSSATVEQGQPVQLSATEDVRIDDAVVIAQGANVAGAIVQAVPKRRMGRSGKLDFSVDRVTTIDGSSIPLRYSLTKKEGGSHSVRTGILTAGAAVVFWPAAPVFLLMKGKDVTINRGTVFEVFTDQKYTLRKSMAATGNGGSSTPPTPSGGGEPARLTITSEPAGADIHLDGSFVGNTPAVVPVAQGAHKIVVGKEGKTWERDLQVHAGSSVSLVAVLK